MFKKLLAFLLSHLPIECCPLQASIGAQAPDFTLSDDTDKPWHLLKQRGKVVVLYFYPSDDTPGCTKQACSLRDGYADFSTLNVVVAGISYNSPKSHKAFKEKYHLPFNLLSDTKKQVAQLYGAKRWWLAPFPKRKTIIIDQHGIVQKIFNDVDVTTHASIVLEAVKKLTKN
jgi:peroxiredoxin Q/BCP